MDIKDKRLKSKYLVRKIFTPNIRDRSKFKIGSTVSTECVSLLNHHKVKKSSVEPS